MRPSPPKTDSHLKPSANKSIKPPSVSSPLERRVGCHQFLPPRSLLIRPVCPLLVSRVMLFERRIYKRSKVSLSVCVQSPVDGSFSACIMLNIKVMQTMLIRRVARSFISGHQNAHNPPVLMCVILTLNY